MNSSFSEGLELSGMSSTTAGVVWSMVIFLIALVIGIFIMFQQQLTKRNSNKLDSNKRKSKPGGF